MPLRARTAWVEPMIIKPHTAPGNALGMRLLSGTLGRGVQGSGSRARAGGETALPRGAPGASGVQGCGARLLCVQGQTLRFLPQGWMGHMARGQRSSLQRDSDAAPKLGVPQAAGSLFLYK